MSHDTQTLEDTRNSTGTTDTPAEQYAELKASADDLTSIINTAVIEPVAKQHFENDRGHPITQVLPDKTENYQFESHGFEALVMPDERRIVNHEYRGTPISPNGIVRAPDEFTDIIDDGEVLWEATFGEHKPHVTQPGHPGPYPLAGDNAATSLDRIMALYKEITGSTDLSMVTEAARDGNYALLADVFDTTATEILSPGGTDLSAIARIDGLTVPYNDDSLAVLRPTPDGSTTDPTRGVIIGHDDTPTGIFAHVTDVTNLSPSQETTHDAIRDAMGFDRELDPWTDIDRLDAQPGERIRLQGDLRVERTEDLEEFPEELARNTRIEEYHELVTDTLSNVMVPSRFIRERGEDLPATTVLDVTVSDDGSVVVDPAAAGRNVELLAYATALVELDVGELSVYEDYEDIPYVHEPTMARRSIARGEVATAISHARDELHSGLEELTAIHQDDVEAEAREIAAEAEASMDIPRQVNLPVDNHMTFVESGFSPDVDTEPVPVAVPEETTLHIVHGEHNTVTTQIEPGVYRFSLLPRGLQPRGDRPDWPEP